MSKFLACTIFFFYLINPICSVVQLKSISSSFPDSPARFTRGLDGGAICGNLRLADPLDACSPLQNEVEHSDGKNATIVLIVRGKCAFEQKIRNAQEVGFDAVIVYDDQNNHNLISMMGKPEGLWIHAVFVSNKAGEILREIAQGVGGECCIASSSDDSWTVLVISFISVIAVISLVIAIYFTVNHRRNLLETTAVLDGKIMDMLPSTTFGSVDLICHVGETCAICLEDYKRGENVKVLPCQHDFHAICVNSWLTKWATFCPVCKLDIRTKFASSIK